MRIQNLTGWLVEGFHCPSAKGNNQDVPYLDGIEEGERRQLEDMASRMALCGDNQAAWVDGVGKNPAKKVEANGWYTAGDTHISQGHGGSCELVDQPVLAEA